MNLQLVSTFEEFMERLITNGIIFVEGVVREQVGNIANHSTNHN
jgi:hypothetical protein